jgi:hypothetical protein
LLAGVLLLAACSGPVQPTPAPPQEEKKFDYRAIAVWAPSRNPEALRVAFWIQNKTEDDATFEFNNAGRVCGFLQKPNGEEILRFPEITAEALGTETLEAGVDRSFSHRIPMAELEGLEPGRYEIKAWLCGHEGLPAWAEFFVRPPVE